MDTYAQSGGLQLLCDMIQYSNVHRLLYKMREQHLDVKAMHDEPDPKRPLSKRVVFHVRRDSNLYMLSEHDLLVSVGGSWIAGSIWAKSIDILLRELLFFYTPSTGSFIASASFPS